MIIFLLLFLTLLPAVSGIINFIGVDNFSDDNYLQTGVDMAVWAMAPIYLTMSGLMLGISVFALFGVYLGGRSNHRRFNDRTIDSINLFRGIFSVTALLRAVFVFLFVEHQPVPTNICLNKNPIPIHSTRRY
jgi:hypothetical protein